MIKNMISNSSLDLTYLTLNYLKMSAKRKGNPSQTPSLHEKILLFFRLLCLSMPQNWAQQFRNAARANLSQSQTNPTGLYSRPRPTIRFSQYHPCRLHTNVSPQPWDLTANAHQEYLSKTHEWSTGRTRSNASARDSPTILWHVLQCQPCHSLEQSRQSSDQARWMIWSIPRFSSNHSSKELQWWRYSGPQKPWITRWCTVPGSGLAWNTRTRSTAVLRARTRSFGFGSRPSWSTAWSMLVRPGGKGKRMFSDCCRARKRSSLANSVANSGNQLLVVQYFCSSSK